MRLRGVWKVSVTCQVGTGQFWTGQNGIGLVGTGQVGTDQGSVRPTFAFRDRVRDWNVQSLNFETGSETQIS